MKPQRFRLKHLDSLDVSEMEKQGHKFQIGLLWMSATRCCFSPSRRFFFSSQSFVVAINAGLNPRGSSDWWHWFALLLIALTRRGHQRLFEGCWSPIHICNTFVLIKCSHSMEIGSLTKRLGPRVIRLIVVTVAASAPRRSIFRVASYWLLKSKRSDQITGWNVMTSCFVQ